MVPRIEHLANDRYQLVLADGSPFFFRAAELQNSSFSSSRYMQKIWPSLVKQHVNAAFGPVAWEDVEPEEGKFTWEELDKLIAGAREHGIKLVLLWFGTWKNGMSNYVPSWVKTDPARFPRARVQPTPGSKTKVVEVLSPFAQTSLTADTKAFEAFMTHLKAVDEDHGTVIMVQVENEVGLLGDSRDRSSSANKVFNSPVPELVIECLGEAAAAGRLNQLLVDHLPVLSGGAEGLTEGRSWPETFGVSAYTDELFMAYHYAQYINTVADAGQKIYNLPMYTNAWLRSADWAPSSTAGGGAQPGEYPTGGPVDSVIDIWQLFAPKVQFVSPDIYHADYEAVFKAYTHNKQPLFIPEHRRDEFGALRMWQAIGQYGALAIGPFGIDTLDPATSSWTKHYGLLSQVETSLLHAWQTRREVTGFYFDRFEAGQSDPSSAKNLVMGGWHLQIERAKIFGHPEPGYGLIIQETDNSFLLVGEGYMVTFRSTDSKSNFTGILSLDELECTDKAKGELRKLRRLNGDEIKSGQGAVMPTMGEGPSYAGYPIAITIAGETGIARCSVYSIVADD